MDNNWVKIINALHSNTTQFLSLTIQTCLCFIQNDRFAQQKQYFEFQRRFYAWIWIEHKSAAASKSFFSLKFAFRVYFRWIIDHLRFTIFVEFLFVFFFQYLKKGWISVNNVFVVVVFVFLRWAHNGWIAFNENKEETKIHW